VRECTLRDPRGNEGKVRLEKMDEGNIVMSLAGKASP